MREHVFASVTLDEVWTVSAGQRSMISSRLEKGRALTRRTGDGFEIDASDVLGPEEAAALDGMVTAEGLLPTAEGTASGPLRIRVVQHARVILMGGLRDVRSERLLVLSSSPHTSIVCSPEALPSFRSLLDPSPMPLAQIDDYRRHPIEWGAGSAAVLMHEAVGHPAERGQDLLRWPEWLSVRDLPTDVMNGGLDDCGQRTKESELTGGSQSFAWRRSSFRDAPMRRMSSLAVRARGVTAIPPADRLRVRLLSGGRYDPLTDSVTLGVAAADLIRGSISMPLAPFTIREPRRAVAEALVGECGPEAMYPGVICIDEGQRVFVPSRACGLLTRPFAEAG